MFNRHKHEWTPWSEPYVMENVEVTIGSFRNSEHDVKYTVQDRRCNICGIVVYQRTRGAKVEVR